MCLFFLPNSHNLASLQEEALGQAFIQPTGQVFPILAFLKTREPSEISQPARMDHDNSRCSGQAVVYSAPKPPKSKVSGKKKQKTRYSITSEGVGGENCISLAAPFRCKSARKILIKSLILTVFPPAQPLLNNCTGSFGLSHIVLRPGCACQGGKKNHDLGLHGFN